MQVEDFARSLRARLEGMYGTGEATAMVRLIFNVMKGWSATDMIVNADREISDMFRNQVGKVMERIERGEPIQYVLGTARFYGMDLKVDSRVLIPRPETEELVDMIVARFKNREDLKVLDIGTGSGAIAIALSRNLPFSDVTGIDLSEGALQVARENAADLHARISLIYADIFKWMPEPDSLDIVVSNPPYIPEEEKRDMETNVLDYEPASALFVPDSDPLVYYRRIAEVASVGLRVDGIIYFEINPRFAEQIKKMLEERGYLDVEVTQDISRRDRFVSARKGGAE